MLRMITALLMCGMAAPAFGAAKVYLKDGGIIEARSVWRTPGWVHVLVNRDTLAEFRTGEIDVARTFPQKRSTRPPRRSGNRPAAAVPRDTPLTGTSPAERGAGISLPGVPSPLRKIAPSSTGTGEEGAIRKHRKEMKQKLEE